MKATIRSMVTLKASRRIEKPIPEIPEDIEEHRSQLDEWLRFSHGLNKIDVTDPANLKVMHRAYYGLVSFVDHLVGELLDELEEQAAAVEGRKAGDRDWDGAFPL